MAHTLKQSAESAINSRASQFHKARIKLTLIYMVGIFIILAFFSISVYWFFTKDISNDLSYSGQEIQDSSKIENEIIDKAQDRLRNDLFFSDSILALLLIVFSYYLSGKTLKPLEIAHIKQKKFVADSAHELKTPLTVIKTGAETVLSKDNSKEEYRKTIKDLLEEANFLSMTVDDLLFLAKSDGANRIERTKVDLSSIAKHESERMKTCADIKGVSLKVNINGEFNVYGNRAHLKRLVVNLLKNAIDYNKPNGEVIITLQKIKNHVLLKITDTGQGVSQENIEKIFDRFYKVNESHTADNGGAGLGLSIVQEIVQHHKGQVEVTSKLGYGTTVSVILPIFPVSN